MKKLTQILLRIIQLVLVLVLLALLVIYISGNGYVFRAVKLTYLKGCETTNIDDHVDFSNNTIDVSTPQAWPLHQAYNKIPLSDTLRKELEDFNSVAFVIVKDGKLLYEEYWDGYSDKSLTNSFSMAKSVVTMLLGKAIDQGYIKSLEQPMVDFIPEFATDSFAVKCTVGDLSAMTSGHGWDEDYHSPFNPTTKAYYGKNIEKQMLNTPFVENPGGAYKYYSSNTQLLAMVIQRAVGMSISEYFSKEFWQPMGMEHPGLWSKDSREGVEKAYCCVNSNAKDFAKLGQLLLQHGRWKDRQILDSAFVAKMTSPNYKAFQVDEPKKYGYSIWIDEEHSPHFYGMMGHLGQRILVVPEQNLVIVRLGKEKDKRALGRGHLDTDCYYFVDEVMEMLKKLD